ncbi:MAG TPA: acylphosphatase [Solirubrobacteraceae bacterium]|nr:acylphosphatase [Solirubrobacteraceae bacterium]
MTPAARHLTVHGDVQGVNFRNATLARAEELGLAGWVANQADGTVAIHAEGTDEVLDALVQWAEQGPPGARVQRVDSAEAPPEGIDGFAMR